MPTTIAIIHPGEMGAAVGAQLRAAGHRVVWAGHERSVATRARAQAAGLEQLGSLADVAAAADVIMSICPPHAALDLARELAGFAGLYVDANAVSPGTAREVDEKFTRFVDGGIVGAPPVKPGTTRLYLSGEEAPAVATLFEGTVIDARVVSSEPGTASAVKMAYAAWTKGRAALILACRELARRERVEADLVSEWETSQPGALDEFDRAQRSAQAKGWRWEGEMQQIADSFAAAELPEGFHRAAAEIYARYPRPGS